MPIITKAGSPVKGSPTQFTLDKTALAAIVADAYYADEDNWKEVVLNYKSSTGNQKEIVKFDASLASPTANFAVSLKAKDVFEIHKIVIKDFDGGAFEVPRSDLTTADFDVDLDATPINSFELIANTTLLGGGFGNAQLGTQFYFDGTDIIYEVPQPVSKVTMQPIAASGYAGQVIINGFTNVGDSVPSFTQTSNFVSSDYVGDQDLILFEFSQPKNFAKYQISFYQIDKSIYAYGLIIDATKRIQFYKLI